MPYDLPLPVALRKAGWKVKIREKERREPPHATILRRTRAWRIDLRTGRFMDREPDPSEVPEELVAHVTAEANWLLLIEQWDRKYPANPVQEREESEEEESDGDEDQR